MKNKRGEILVENVIFIALNLIFLTILILFLFSKMGSSAVLEEKYAKQIALIIDSAKPTMEINLNMQDAIKKAEKEKFEEPIVKITNNIVTVKLRKEGAGYLYSFFNNVDANAYQLNEESYVLTISGYK
jgi:hypothetical protein